MNKKSYLLALALFYTPFFYAKQEATRGNAVFAKAVVKLVSSQEDEISDMAQTVREAARIISRAVVEHVEVTSEQASELKEICKALRQYIRDGNDALSTLNDHARFLYNRQLRKQFFDGCYATLQDEDLKEQLVATLDGLPTLLSELADELRIKNKEIQAMVDDCNTSLVSIDEQLSSCIDLLFDVAAYYIPLAEQSILGSSSHDKKDLAAVVRQHPQTVRLLQKLSTQGRGLYAIFNEALANQRGPVPAAAAKWRAVAEAWRIELLDTMLAEAETAFEEKE